MSNHQLLVLAVSIPFFVLACIFVGLYFISSIFVVKRLDLNDYLMLLAWVINVGFMTSLVVAIKKGLGLHEPDIKPINYHGLDRADYVFTFLYGPTSMAAKSSILTFYLTLTHPSKTFRSANYITLFVVNAGGLAVTVTEAIECLPLGIKEHCTEVFTVALASSPLNIVTDVTILFLPIPLLTRMRLPWKQKVLLVLTFSAGFGVIVVDIIRIAFLQNAVMSNSDPKNNTPWLASLAFMWASVEVNMTIICACVPSLKPLVDRFVPKLISDTDKNAPATGQDSIRPTPAGDMMTVLTTPSGQPKEVEPYITIFGISNFKPASLPKLNNKKSLRPLAFVNIMFVLWGVGYGFLAMVSPKFVSIAHQTELHDLGIRAAYWVGYLLSPLILARPLLKRSGYRATFITSLLIYSCGTLVFWPSGVLTSFIAFVVSNLLVGFGLGAWEAAADSFLAICGPLENAEVRLNLAQGCWAFGSSLSSLFAEKVIFKAVRNTVNLANVQWVFLATTFFDVLLAVSFWYLRLPEAPDADMDELASRRKDNFTKVAGVQVTWWTLGLALWSEFFILAAVEVFRTGVENFVKAVDGRTHLAPSDYQIIGISLYGICRFLVAFSIWYFKLKPRRVLLAVNISALIFSILCTKMTGSTAMVMGLLTEFVAGGGLYLTFAIALRGQGRHTKTAASLLAMTMTSGAFFPFASNAIAVAHGTRASFYLVVACWVAAAVFPLYLNFVPAARKQVDPVLDEYLHE